MSTVYELVTERLIEAIESGVTPWKKPWTTDGLYIAPRNAVSGKTYRGINSILLGCSSFTDCRWVTFNQAKTLGGCVRKGEKGTPIVFWKWVEAKSTQEGEDEEGKKVKGKRIPILRYYTVFNVQQCDGLKLKSLPEFKPLNPAQRIARAEAIINGMPNQPLTNHGSDRACYIPSLDLVKLPDPERFDTIEAYYSTRFHELVHATGSGDRLNRPMGNAFGSDPYAREELVAEMGSAFLCAFAGIDGMIDQSAAYLRGWLKVLKSDSKFAIIAAGQAQKAVDWILDEGDEEEENTD